MLAGLLLLCGKEEIVKVAGCLGAACLQDGEWESERNRGYWHVTGSSSREVQVGKLSARAVKKSVTFGYRQKDLGHDSASWSEDLQLSCMRTNVGP
jgi:hypothetical protein